MRETKVHWESIKLLSLHFSLLLLFPLWGPILGRLATEYQTDILGVGLSFISASVVGFATIPHLPLLFENMKMKCLYASRIIGLIVLIWHIWPATYWWILALVFGICSSFIIYYWYLSFTENVKSSRDQWLTIALTIAIANCTLYIANFAAVYLPTAALYLLLWVLAVLSIQSIKKATLVTTQPLVELTTPKLTRNVAASTWWFTVLVFCLFLPGSMVSELVYTGLFADSWINYYNLLPYISIVLVLAYYGERYQHLMPIAAIFLFGLSILLKLLMSSLPLASFFSIVCVMIAFAVVDVFLWTHITRYQQENRRVHMIKFGIGLAVNLLAVGLGTVIMQKGNPHINQLTLGAGIIVLFIAVIPLYIYWRDQQMPVNYELAACSLPNSINNDQLTKREKEVVLLLIAGKSNEDIGNELHISLSTVRSHLRSIYRKTGYANRRELLADVIKG